jgi:regulatory protein
MVKISSIGEIKRRKDLRQVITDDGGIFAVSQDIIITRGIERGSEFSSEEWEELLILSDYERGLSYAIDCIARGPKTVKEIRDKLKVKTVRDEAADRIIARLKELNYLDDERYAADYAESYGESKGKLRIRQELYQKGIKSAYIDAALQEMGDELSAAKALSEKYLKGRKCEGKEREQLIRYLAGRGYSFDLIRDALKSLGGEADDLSDL